VPRVPIATGAIAGIFSGNLVVVGLALYCILYINKKKYIEACG
jgi:hypothetical protein